MELQTPHCSPDTTHPAQLQARACQIPSYLQTYEVALPKSLLPVTGPYEPYQQPKMDHAAAPLTLNGQAEPALTGVQPTRHELSSLQYGPAPAIVSGDSIDAWSGGAARCYEISFLFPLHISRYNSQSECELSSGTVSPFSEQMEQVQAYSPPIVRPKATAVPAIRLLDSEPLTSCLGAPRDVSQQSGQWQTSPTTAHMVYSTPTPLPFIQLPAATYVRHTPAACSATSSSASYNLISSLPQTITSVNLPIATTVRNTLVPPVYQLQIPAHSQLQYQPTPVPDLYQLSPLVTGYYTPQPLSQSSVQNWYPTPAAHTVLFPPSHAHPVCQPAPAAPALQPVPVPSLPKLVNDSEREFTDLKIAIDNLLKPYTELTEHYKYCVLMEQLVLDEARLIAQVCRHHPGPYTAAMAALQHQYGQPHQLAQSEVAALMNSPEIKTGDSKAFQNFAPVGMLTSLEGPQGRELTCSGHVDRLLSKLPKHYRDGFIEYLQLRGRQS